MAVSKLLAGNTKDLNVLLDFISTNKEGTFLEDMTVEATNPTSQVRNLIITGANNTFTLHLHAGYSSSSAVYLCELGGDVRTSTFGYKSGTNYGYNTYINSAILCNNGLLIFLRVPYYYNSPNYSYGLCSVLVTVDSNGDLAAVYERDNFMVGETSTINSNKGYRAVTIKSTEDAAVTVTPQFSSIRTSFAPVVPASSDNELALPNVYAALHTQLSGAALAEVAVGSDIYITNGAWYVKD